MQDPHVLKDPFNPSPMAPCVCGGEKTFARCCGLDAADRPPPVGIHLIQNYVDANTCAHWVAVLEQQPREPLAVHNRSKQGMNASMSSGRVTDKVEPGALRAEINRVVESAFREVLPVKTGDTIEWYENPQVLRYSPGGQYGRHADADHFLPGERKWIRSIDRDYSLLLYLNDGFEGGELTFFRYNYSHKPRCGDLLMFPSDNRFVHQAQLLRSGVRFAVVSWAARCGGPRTGQPPPPGITRLA